MSGLFSMGSFKQFGGSSSGKEGPRASLQRGVELRNIALDKSACTVEQQHKWLIVMVLIMAPLPLKRDAPAMRLDLRSSIAQLGMDIHQSVFAYNPIRIRLYGRVHSNFLNLQVSGQAEERPVQSRR